MPSSLPTLKTLRPPLTSRRLTKREQHEARAVRLALVMVTTVLHQSDLFLSHNRPIPGGHTADVRWLHQSLQPLAAHAPTVKKIMHLFDQRRYGQEWYHPVRVRRNLTQLKRDAVTLANVLAAASPTRRLSPKRGVR